MYLSIKLSSLLAILLILPAVAQNETTVPSLVDRLIPSFTPTINEAASALFPLTILLAQTPIQIRFVFLFTLSNREVTSGCHPTALSFFGVKDVIPPHLCATPKDLAQFLSYMVYHGLKMDFPVTMRGYAAFLMRMGLTPLDMSTDLSTFSGWSNLMGSRLASHFVKDGWNSQGLAASTFFPKPFADVTNYRPANAPSLPASELLRPLRWQPLTQSYDNNGNYASQIHITPHIGLTVRPFTLTRAEFRARRVKSLYHWPNKARKMSARDERVARMLITDLLEENRGMTERKLGLAAWWDSKIFSLGQFIGVYSRQLQLSFPEQVSMAVSEMIAQHDAVLLAWKEKRRHDLVRPQTLMRHLLPGQTIKAWRGFGYGVGDIKVEEWESSIPTMPHSEYPSATAVICTASLDVWDVAMKRILGQNATLPKFIGRVLPNTFLGYPMDKPINIVFNTPKEAIYSCSRSRLWTGLHFGPAVGQGRKLAAGIGGKALDLIAALDAGKIPKNCHWCISK